jgi:uncharacterized protein YycO
MKKIKLIFSNSKLPLSPLIRWVTWSDFSHVALLLDEDTIIESTLSHNGVQIDSLINFKNRAKNWLIVELEINIEHLNWDDLVSIAKNEVGKPYDLLGILGLSIHRNWQEDDKWWCSELIPYILLKWGIRLFNSEFIHRIVPQHLLILPSTKIDSSI